MHEKILSFPTEFVLHGRYMPYLPRNLWDPPTGHETKFQHTKHNALIMLLLFSPGIVLSRHGRSKCHAKNFQAQEFDAMLCTENCHNLKLTRNHKD
jgi:hypothetical protein